MLNYQRVLSSIWWRLSSEPTERLVALQWWPDIDSAIRGATSTTFWVLAVLAQLIDYNDYNDYNIYNSTNYVGAQVLQQRLHSNLEAKRSKAQYFVTLRDTFAAYGLTVWPFDP